MRKSVLVAVAIAMLLAACGKAKQSNVTLGETSSSPGASTSAAPGSSKAPKASAAPGTTKAPSASSSSSSGTKNVTTPKPASQGGANPPKDGTYTYRTDGNSNSPQTGPQTYTNQTVTSKISHSGNVYSTAQSTNQGTSTSKNQWTSTEVLFLSININSPYGTFSCTYNPPLVITKFPTKPETFPQQKLDGSGNACGGTLDISVLRKENVTDAAGHTWSAWLYHVKITSSFTYNGAPVTSKSDEMRWFSPDIGVQVKSVADTTMTSALGTTTGHSTTLLKTRP